MEILLFILLIIYVITIILRIKVDKQRDDLIEEILDFNKRLVTERNEIAKILIEAKIETENSSETLEKIKKELDVGKTY